MAGEVEAREGLQLRFAVGEPAKGLGEVGQVGPGMADARAAASDLAFRTDSDLAQLAAIRAGLGALIKAGR